MPGGIMNIWIYVLAGIGGGLLRGLVGYLKYLTAYKGVKFDTKYFAITVGLAGFIGGIAGVIANGVLVDTSMNIYYAVLAGYAGGDFFENAFKVVYKKPMLFKLPEVLADSLKSATK
jgi:hypothetical protein